MTRRLTEPRLLIATHNAGKLAEMAALLAPHGIEAVGAATMDLPEPDETEDNFVGNARIKAVAASRATGLPALADDSGICIDALEGAPGVQTADWAETPDGRDFAAAMHRTNEALSAIDAPYPRHAQFRCTFVLVWPDGEEAVFEGVMPGRVVWPPQGDHGHGYDPIFVPDGHDVTFAQMAPVLKNRISHRARAFDAFASACLG